MQWRRTDIVIGMLLARCVCVSSFAQIGVPLAKPTEINIDSQRPLWIALEQVEQLTYFPVNLEDIPYASADSLTTLDTLTNNGTHFRPVTPRGGKLQVSLAAGESACQSAQDVLVAYARAGLPGSFTAICESNRVDVVPTSFTDASGVAKEATPVMSVPITFPEVSRSVAVTFQLIADSVSKAAGAKVLLGRVPFPENTNITIGASQEPAESVIARMGPMLRPIAFWMGYEPNMKAYFLNLRLVPFAPAAGPQSKPQPGAGPGVQHPKQSPFFKKAQ